MAEVAADTVDGLLALLQQDDGDADEAAALVLRADATGTLPGLLRAVIANGAYEALRDRLSRGARPDAEDHPALRRLAAARPGFGEEVLNEPPSAALRARRGATAYDVLIVPGYTPIDASEPQALRPEAKERLHYAMRCLSGGLATAVLVSGGCVHPPGTPLNEALLMREYLLSVGLAPEQVLIEPYARHTTTNLRNAGRLLRGLGLARALIITGFESSTFSQAFYLANPTLSTFHVRCLSQLGYLVGDLTPTTDDNAIAFTPAAAVDTPDYRDPLDW